MNQLDQENVGGFEVAIVGLTGRFPGARTLDEFWRNLRDGAESIAFFDDGEVEAAGVDPNLLSDPRYVKAGGALADVELFDAAFFGFYPKEAEVLDPQHRIFLECAWEALEHAGYDPDRYTGLIGVFAGVGLNTYLLHHLLSNRAATAAVGEYQLMLGNDKDFLPTRVSYKLNLRGPSINIQTACSTSLVAVHLACQNLLNYQCDMALAGGIAVRLPQQQGYLYQDGGIASPDGHCRVFDARAQGTVPGNGVGIVVLKRLADALQDGDTIYAVIKGSAINNDGALKVGYTAPSVDGQAEVIATAQALAGVEPETISYIEAHGTGTPIGDPIEVMALNQVFGGRAARESVAIGSVKSNIGHLDAAAGVAGLIKATLALTNQAIPPSLHFERSNPALNLDKTPFYVNNYLNPWPRGEQPRRAGVSSFGIGGTNAHVVIEEAPAPEPSGESRPWQVLLCSAKTPTALEATCASMAAHLRAHPEQALADIAYTTQVGRQAFAHRSAIICHDAAEAAAALEGDDPQRRIGGQTSGERPVAFLFTGQGSQYVHMAAGLYATEPVFRGHVDTCADILTPHLGMDVRELIFDSRYPIADSRSSIADSRYPIADSRYSIADDQRPTDDGHLLDQTQYTQPALFVIEYALAQLWMNWGVQPAAMIGHSIGEYVAACLAGVFSLEDALALVAARGRLMQRMPPGTMVSVPISEGRLRPLLGPDLALAAVNAPELCVVAGADAAITVLEQRLADEQIAFRRLHTSHAFHSAMMDPILEPFRRIVERIELNPPQLPYVSNVSGGWITDDEATDPSYWVRHLRQTVRFSDGLATVLADSSLVLLEVGPGQTLGTFARRHPAAGPGRVVLASLRHPQDTQDDTALLLTTLARLWIAGVRIDWFSFSNDERRRRVPLPTYPFERRRYWVEAIPAALQAVGPVEIRKRREVDDWLYAPSWRRADLPKPHDLPATVLLLANDGEQTRVLAQHLAARDVETVLVRPGARFMQHDDGSFTLNPCEPGDYTALIEALYRQGLPPVVLHAWTLADEPLDLDEAQVLGAFGLIRLAQALAAIEGSPRLRVLAITSGTQEVTGDETLYPQYATLLGPCRVIPQEHPQITCRLIDAGRPQSEAELSRIADQLLAELGAPEGETVVAYRGRHRWVQTFAPQPFGQTAGPRLRERGVYLITGGLGRIGLASAAELARSVQARLVLVGRSAPEGSSSWDQQVSGELHLHSLITEAWTTGHPNGSDHPSSNGKLAASPQADPVLDQIATLEALGAAVLVLRADVADAEQLRRVVSTAEARFGAIHGVFHCAGFVGEESLRAVSELTPDDYEAHLRAKVRGTLALDAALHGRTIDFCLLQSSLSTVLGGLGMAAYAAANAFLDSFAQRQRQAGRPWLSVDWDAWRFDGTHEQEGGRQGFGRAAAIEDLALTPDEGLATLRRILGLADVAQVVVSTADLQARIDHYTRQALAEATVEEPASTYARPLAADSYVAPRDDLEHAIAAEWQRVLGIEQIGVYDNFFELGGHSLLATQLVSRLRDTYHVELPLRNLFETPTVAGIATLIARSQDTAKTAVASRTILPRLHNEEMTLSFGQQRLWFLDQLEPGSPLYNNPAAVRITGSIDVAVLERCLHEIVRRHEVLRTTYTASDGRPVPVVSTPEEANAPVSEFDLRSLPASEREDAVRQLAAREAQHPFDLARGPLLRVVVARLSDEESVVLLTMQHIVSDGWSMVVFIRELVALYEAFAAGRGSPLPELSIQYADYATWQREQLQGEARERELTYWKDYLAGAATLELPTDRPRPAVQTYAGATHWFAVPGDLAKKLEQLAQREGATLFMTLLAGFQALLARYSGQDDIVVGSPIAGRTHAEVEPLIGFFVNTLVLRGDLSGDPSFRELLGRTREMALGAYAHQELPFEMLVDEVQPERDLSRTPLFQVMFVLQDAPLPYLSVPGLAFSPVEIDTGTAKFDLTLYLELGGNDLRGWLNYNTDLFDAGTIERLQEHWLNLLRSAVDNPEQRLSELELLGEAERHTLLNGFNATATGAPPAAPVHRQFEAQAARTPEAVAVDCEGDRLTYRELNRRANQLARHLRTAGVGPETLVGVCLERSVESIVALLGVLKSGGAYLPLDPAYPAERLAFMLEDSGARVVIAGKDRPSDFGFWILDFGLGAPTSDERRAILDDELRTTDDGRRTMDDGRRAVVDLVTDWPMIAQERDDDLEDIATRAHLAYVIYTSGSTGVPKGVMIEHGAFADHCRDVVRFYELAPADSVLAFASLNFDASLEQIVPTLIAGAKLVLRGPEIWRTADFHRKVAEHGLTVINPPTAYWHQLAQEWASHPELAPAGRLRLVIAGGDAMRPEVVRLWQQTPLADIRLLNAYGPTETTITATTYTVPKLDNAAATLRIPIGQPLPNRSLYILDAKGNPAPIGVPGELYIGGQGVARGYLNRPDLTAERFRDVGLGYSKIQNPKSKIYKTGDLARWLPDGTVEFLGRADQQVKIRGFRVEPGEIEAALAQHPEVREAVVVAREDWPGEKRLVAYVVTGDGGWGMGNGTPALENSDSTPVTHHPSPITQLRAWLNDRLPDYMTPATFVILEALPLTPGGKVDRKALPTPEATPSDHKHGYVPPRTPVEQELATLWADVLKVDRVGIDDDFFELGGHSLLATQLASRLRTTFQVEIPLRRLFETPTIAGLALLLAETQAAQVEADELARLLAEIEGLSDDEAYDILAHEVGG